MPFIKDSIGILLEAKKAETSEVDGAFYDDIESEFEDSYMDTNMEEIDENAIKYSEDMVCVFEHEESQYLVEFDVVAKYMMHNDITDIKEALDNIANHNSIDVANMCLVIESDEYAYSMMEATKKDKNMGLLKKASDFLKDTKNKGIKVAKKKSKNKPRVTKKKKK